MVMMVRQSSARTARKLKWYEALGVETVSRASGASKIQDALAYLSVLKRGKMLAVTPDLLAGPEQGVEVSIFGRRARVFGGAFALANLVGAPMIRVSGQWYGESSVVLTFERAPRIDVGDRDAAIRVAAQEWCRWFEGRLRASPENWLFWLDKRWSHFLRTTPTTSVAK